MIPKSDQKNDELKERKKMLFPKELEEIRIILTREFLRHNPGASDDQLRGYALGVIDGMLWRERCFACNGKGYYDAVWHPGDSLICIQCNGSGIDQKNLGRSREEDTHKVIVERE